MDDGRGLCPSGWHVPTDGEWMTMEMALGMSEDVAKSTPVPGYRGTEGLQLKSAYGWYGGGNGTNASGFSGLPGGQRSIVGSFFGEGGISGNWWTSSSDSRNAYFRGLDDDFTSIGRRAIGKKHGLSVRCIRSD